MTIHEKSIGNILGSSMNILVSMYSWCVCAYMWIYLSKGEFSADIFKWNKFPQIIFSFYKFWYLSTLTSVFYIFQEFFHKDVSTVVWNIFEYNIKLLTRFFFLNYGLYGIYKYLWNELLMFINSNRIIPFSNLRMRWTDNI